MGPAGGGPARLGWVQTFCKLNAESSKRPIEGSFGFFIGEEVRVREYAAKCPRIRAIFTDIAHVRS